MKWLGEAGSCPSRSIWSKNVCIILTSPGMFVVINVLVCYETGYQYLVQYYHKIFELVNVDSVLKLVLHMAQ